MVAKPLTVTVGIALSDSGGMRHIVAELSDDGGVWLGCPSGLPPFVTKAEPTNEGPQPDGGSMTTEPTPTPKPARLERTYHAPAELIWELWTTAAGLEEWWTPDGFETRVSELELRPGGQVRYTMT